MIIFIVSWCTKLVLLSKTELLKHANNSKGEKHRTKKKLRTNFSQNFKNSGQIFCKIVNLGKTKNAVLDNIFFVSLLNG